MRSASELEAFIQADDGMVRALRAVAELKLRDGWIGAGFIRNAVWDRLHGLPRSPVADVDVVHFDPFAKDPASDEANEARLSKAMPGLTWSVRNQARMHLRNGHPPYVSTLDAIGHWVETATAVAARMDGGRVVVAAPHGFADLLDLVLRPVPAYRDRPEVMEARCREKGWLRRWSGLRFAGL